MYVNRISQNNNDILFPRGTSQGGLATLWRPAWERSTRRHEWTEALLSQMIDFVALSTKIPSNLVIVFIRKVYWVLLVVMFS
jgi:hypothetical protein